MKPLITFLLFFMVLQIFAQIPTKKDSLSITFLEKKEVQLWIDYNKIPFEETRKNAYHLITLIKKKKNTIDKENRKLIKRVDELHIKTISFLNQSIHDTQRQYDSIIYYNSYAKQLSPTNNYILGSFESMSGWANYQLLNYVDAIKHYRNAIDYFRKSKHHDSNKAEILTLSIMLDFYISINSFSNAEEVFAIFESKIQNLNKPLWT